MDLNEDGTPKLVMLTKLPKSGFTKQILQRRILQWRRMGLDTAEIESSLYHEDIRIDVYGIHSDGRKCPPCCRIGTLYSWLK